MARILYRHPIWCYLMGTLLWDLLLGLVFKQLQTPIELIVVLTFSMGSLVTIVFFALYSVARSKVYQNARQEMEEKLQELGFYKKDVPIN